MSPPFRTCSRFILAALLGLGACEAQDIGDRDPVAEPEPFPEVEPGEQTLPRLTRTQYENSLRDIFGDELAVPTRIEPDVSIDGLRAIGASHTTISPRGAEQYESASYEVAKQVMAEGAMRDALMSCTPTTTRHDACAEEVLGALGRRVWRRPLTEVELSVLTDIAGDAATTLGDFYQGMEFGVAALLQSPNFLFRVELGEAESPDEARRYSSYEMASRLSFFLWNTTPDLELLDAAEAGELLDDESLRAHAERMVESPRAREAVRNFFTDYYELYKLDELNKDPVEFVHMSAELGQMAREETLRLIDHLVFDARADFRELFTTKKTFVNRKLAAIYDIPAPSPQGFAEARFPADSLRSGILTHVSLLAGNSHPIDTSPTLRGKFVRKKLLCGLIFPPPVDVDASIPEPSEDAKTMRERLTAHVAEPSCAGCHLTMDPIGLGLENFDALGHFRTTDNGAPIDASGDLDGESYGDPVGLGQRLAENRDVPRCLVDNMFRYANSRVEADSERELLAALRDRFELRNYRVDELMVDVVLSPGFRSTVAPSNEEGQQ